MSRERYGAMFSIEALQWELRMGAVEGEMHSGGGTLGHGVAGKICVSEKVQRGFMEGVSDETELPVSSRVEDIANEAQQPLFTLICPRCGPGRGSTYRSLSGRRT